MSNENPAASVPPAQAEVAEGPATAAPEAESASTAEESAYPERSYAEASEGMVSFDPANPDHQELRLKNSSDYVEDTKNLYPGYMAPEYA